jgi:hypothetical protein
VNNNEFVYDDYTQGIGDYVYSIVPVAVNETEGIPNSVEVNSTFAGWHLVDKQTNRIISFDKFLGSEASASTSINQGRTQIDTLSRFPRFVYTDQDYHTFSLQGVFIPEDWETSGQLYQSIVDTYIRSHKPFLCKSGSGEIYIVECSSPNKSAPQNVYKGYDYFELTMQFTEVMTESEYNELFL